MRSYTFYLLALLLSPGLAVAEESYSFDLMRFNYSEYDDNGTWLDSEYGVIPGIIIRNREKLSDSHWSEWEGRFHYSLIYYDGQTQSGIPLRTRSDALIMDIAGKYGIDFSNAYGRDMSLYFGLGYRYWLRNIHRGIADDGSATAGIAETYRWLYGLAGYQALFQASKKVKMGFDFRYTRMLSAQMDINFLGYGGYDNTMVTLGNRSGARLSIPLQISTRRGHFSITPYYELIDIGRSNNVTITSNGTPVTGCNPDPCQLYEPRSETRNIGIEFNWKW